ncbi:MFS transporter [Rhodococcus jostii]|uniref:MFS transporter n=1 Tax=Rhodococcus jostii TaxID=132919 RepID=UPI003639C524
MPHSLRLRTVISGFSLTQFVYASLSVLYTYAPEIFPIHVRGLGSGIGNGIGRVAGLAVGFIIAGVFNSLGFTAVFAFMALCAMIFAAAMGTFGINTTNRRPRGPPILGFERETRWPDLAR